MQLRVVASQDEDLEPVLRRLPAAAAQLGQADQSEGPGLERRKMGLRIRELGDGYEDMSKGRGLSGGCMDRAGVVWGQGRDGARARRLCRNTGLREARVAQ